MPRKQPYVSLRVIPRRQHTLNSFAEARVPSNPYHIVTMPRAPWEPAETTTGPRPETAPSPRLIKRKQDPRTENSRIGQHIAALKAALNEIREEMA